MKLFLDDIRCPVECASYMHNRIGKDNSIYLQGEWFIVRNFEQFKNAISRYNEDITHISFDHDLADEHYVPEEYWSDFQRSKEYQEKQIYTEKTGYDCAVLMKGFYDLYKIEYPIMYVHSMNPVGAEKIINLFKSN